MSASLAELLSSRGFNTLITVRSYDYALSLAMKLQLKNMVAVGVHGGGRLSGKLIADLGRMIDILPLLEDRDVVALISYPSPPAVRVAFGLGIPYIAMGDTPHGEAMNRLCYPLARVAVLSEFIAEDLLKFFLKDFTVIETYKGVDEILWVKNFNCRDYSREIKEIGLEPMTYVVLRPEEFKAHYYSRRGESWVLKLAETTKRHGYTPVILPRYEDQALEAMRLEGVIVLDKPVFGPALECHSAAVVTGGITMAREAALLGVPGISVFDKPIRIDLKLAELGAPLSYAGSFEEAESQLSRILRDPESFRVDSHSILSELETPSDKILYWVEVLASERRLRK